MRILKKIGDWLLDRWQLVLAAIAALIAYLKIKENDRLKAEQEANEAAEKTRQAKLRAEEEEKERVRQAELRAEEEKRKRDEIIKNERKETDAKIDEQVNEQIEKDVKDPENLAQDFASTFGGTYVKKDD